MSKPPRCGAPLPDNSDRKRRPGSHCRIHVRVEGTRCHNHRDVPPEPNPD